MQIFWYFEYCVCLLFQIIFNFIVLLYNYSPYTIVIRTYYIRIHIGTKSCKKISSRCKSISKQYGRYILEPFFNFLKRGWYFYQLKRFSYKILYLGFSFNVKIINDRLTYKCKRLFDLQLPIVIKK